MNTYFLYLFDQERSIMGILLGAILVCLPSVQKREKFLLRLFSGIIACSIQAWFWMLIYEKIQTDYVKYSYIGFLHLVGNSLVVLAVVMLCFEISAAEALFRCIIGRIMEATVTIFLRNVVVYLFMEDLPSKHFAIYLVIVVLFYILVYGGLFRRAIKAVNEGSASEYFVSNRSRIIYFAGIYTGITVLIGLIQTICERLIQPLTGYKEFYSLYMDIYVFAMIALAIICALIMTTLVRFYRLSVLEAEKSLLGQLLTDKEKQYSFIRENVDVINSKCHELRKQLKSLEDDSSTENKATIREISRALNFYDSTVKTGNEVLDTILTEKSLLCANRGIKLSCMINSENAAQIRTMDLYTILDIALDSAIRYESSLSDADKKLISFMLTHAGSMTYIVIENYYDPEAAPYSAVTSRENKKDRDTIRRIAKRYHGEIQTSKENNIYQLQIILPNTN